MEGTTVLGRVTWHVGEVVDTARETAHVKSLVFAVPDWPGHQAGQHVDLRLTADDGYQAVRSYSIASPPEDHRLVLTVEELLDGEVSPYLVEEVRPGDPLEIRGPIGGYFVWTAAMGGPLMLIAGGSGIVPLMAMLRHRSMTGSPIPARLLYSVRSPDDMVYRDEVERLARGDAPVEVFTTYTRIAPPQWTGYRRRVDTKMLEEVVWPREARPLTYICGPTQFVETVAEDVLRLGHEPVRVKTERFGPTGG